jgi:hypothetical protein
MSDEPIRVVVFEDEDEETLKAEFVRLMAKHKQKYSAYEVAKYVFRDLKDPDLRAAQAAQVWGNDIEIKEQIDEAILYGPDGKTDEKEKLIAVLKGIYEDQGVAARDRINAVRQHAELQGMIVVRKETEKKLLAGEGLPGLPRIVLAEYND